MKNRIIAYLSLFVLLFSVLGINVQAANTATVTPWIDDAGDLYFRTVDHKSPGKLTYKTIGVTISRCVPGTKIISSDGEYIVLPFDSSSGFYDETDLGGGFIAPVFKISADKLKEKIEEYYGYWLLELEGITDQQIYIKIDSIMCCCNEGKQYGYIMSDGSRTGLFIGNTFWNVPNDMYCRECADSIHLPLVEGWRDNTFTSSSPICAMNHPNAKDGNFDHE